MLGLTGANNTIVGAADDTIYAGNLNDTITAGKNDSLTAGAGVDTFIFNAGDGAVTLNDSATKTTGTNQDILQLGAGITEAATQVSRTLSNALVLSFGSGDQLTIPSYFMQASGRLPVVFPDATTWDYATLAKRAAVFVDTSTGGNFVTGISGVNNTITGAFGDTIMAGSLNDTIISGRNDTLYAGAGADTFVFTQGSGAVTLYESFTKTAGANLDTLQLGAGITEANTQVTRNSSNGLVLSFGNGDQVTVPYYFSYAVCRPTIAFADGTQWNFATVAGALGYGAPTVTQSLASENATAGTRFSFALPGAVFSDAGANDSLTLSAKLANGNPLPSWLIFDPTTGTFSGTPTDQNAGALTVKIVAKDVVGMTASTTLNLQVNPAWQAPVLGQTLTTETIAAGNAWNYALPATLFNEAIAGDTLTYTAVLPNGDPLPAWLTFDPAKQTFSGTPTDQTTGAFKVAITATDLGGQATTTMLNVQINPTWQAPTVTQTLPSQSVTAGVAWNYSLPASLFNEAVAGDTVSYTATQVDGSALPEWLSFDARNLVFSGTPPSGSTGTVVLKITATDMGGLSASTALNIVATSPSTTPVVTQSLSSQTIAAGSAWSFALPAGLFSESVVGDTLTYSATLANGDPLPSWLTFDPASFTFRGTPTDQTTGAMQLNITATEQGGLSASAPLNVTVNPVYAPPTASQPLFGMAALGQPWRYTLPANAFSEPVAGDTLTYSAKMADGSALPSWLTFDPLRKTFSGTPTGQVASELDLNITATDLGGLSSSTILTVQLQPNILNVASFQTLAAPAGQVAIQEASDFSTVTAGDENHVLLIAASFGSATLGNGANWIGMSGGFANVTAGDGNNQINVSGDESGGFDTFALGNGNNLINASGDFDTFKVGNGNNVINASGDFDSVTVGAGTNQIDATGMFAGVHLGDGTDTVTMTNTYEGATVGHGTYTLEYGGSFGSLRFGADTASDHLWFQQVGQDLLITELGQGGTVTAKNWFAAKPEQAYGISAGDGKSISSSGVNQLVQAMAAFAPPAPGATSFTAAEQQTLKPVLAANWH